jgi:predicted nucleic acid-binding protein
MDDPRRHVIVDANLLIYYLHPESADTITVRDRCRVLFDSVLTAKWSGIRLYVPAISVAEAIGVLDKYRFCTWSGPVKGHPSRRLSSPEYRMARRRLLEAIRIRQLEQIDHEPTHVSLASLISPVNQIFQFRRHRGAGHKVKRPMGAADCLIVGMAVLLQRRLGAEQVVLATADQRMADVVTKCRSLTEARAETLGIKATAEAVGIAWSDKAFPMVVNIRDARMPELRSVFLGWPLPTSTGTTKGHSELTAADEEHLGQVWQRVAGRHGVTNPDSIPHTPTICELRTEFAARSGVEMTCREIFLALLGMRKAKCLPKPKGRAC